MPRKLSLILPLLLVVLLTGCATSKDDANPAANQPASSGDRVSVTNCQRDVTIDAPAQRIVSMNGHVTEVLIRLGLTDRIVGTAYPDNEPPAEFAEEWAKIPELSKEFPSMEQILDVEPDLVIGGMTSAFDEKAGRSRDAFAEHGIATFLFSEYCSEGAFDVDMVTEDVRQIGALTGVEDAATQLADSVSGEMDHISSAVADAPPVPTFIYDSGTDEPLTVGGVGVGQLIVSSAGGENVFADRDRPYASASWEQVAERAPEAIIIMDYGDNTAEQKIAFLKDHPLMRTTPAVKNDRFVVVQLSDFFEGPRMVDATRTVASFLHPDADL